MKKKQKNAREIEIERKKIDCGVEIDDDDDDDKKCYLFSLEFFCVIFKRAYTLKEKKLKINKI